jgi:alpha-tubulin suppressor-like RCC1 family protein
LRADGTVAAWGDNSYGQTNVPTDLTNAIAIAAGRVFNLALRSDGSVVAWGTGFSGETIVPSDLTNVVAIAAGGEHSLALKNDGTVAAWGRNIGPSGGFAGQAVVPAGLSNVVEIAGGAYHSLAIVDTPTLRPILFNPTRQGATFNAVLATLNRKSYALEYLNSLSEITWTRLPAIAGNGGSRILTDPAATGPVRIYRAVQQ